MSHQPLSFLLEYITLWDLQKYSVLPVNANQVCISAGNLYNLHSNSLGEIASGREKKVMKVKSEVVKVGGEFWVKSTQKYWRNTFWFWSGHLVGRSADSFPTLF